MQPPINRANCMNKISFLVLLSVFSIKSYSTCIVIIKTNNEIFIGADSKRTIHIVNPETGMIRDSIINTFCKIHRVGKFYFAIAGFDDDGVLRNATTACENGKSLEQIIESFSNSMRSEYERNIGDYRTVNKMAYLERFATNNISQIAFFCFIENKPYLISITFNLTNLPNEPIKVSTTIEKNQSMAILGVFDHIDTLPESEINTLFKSRDYIKIIKTLIMVEAKNHPDWVSEPIDILKLTKTGELWLSRKENCKT
jgi:hypothetical protein